MNTGYFDLLTDEKYLNSEKFLQRGDILVVVSSHTIIALEDGIMADISKAETINNTPIKAIDLSKYNIVTDYKQMANEISHVIIRVGYRSSTSGNIIEDDLFQKHITNCISNGINNLGIYFYDQSINEIEAVEQADWVINKIKSYNINLPIYIDSEAMPNHTGRADNISKEQRTKNIIAFCNRIQELGFTAGVYFSNSWAKSMVEFDKLKYFNIWCARYSTQKPDISKYDIWQYGSEQFIWGQKPIDVNWIYNLSINTQKPENGANKKEIKGINNVVKVSDYLNIRNQPLSNAQIVGKLYLNDKVNIYGYVHDWYMISKTMDKWVSAKYVFTNIGKTTANLNYRTGVGTQNKSLGVYEKGTVVKLLNKETYNGETWYLCLDNKDRFGWCSGKYIE
jgi:GH25 family lysozyme M1 (1,4-beta-N-acetylmuramidase)